MQLNNKAFVLCLVCNECNDIVIGPLSEIESAPFNAARALAEDVAFAGRNGLAAAVFDVSSFSLPGLSERSQRRP